MKNMNTQIKINGETFTNYKNIRRSFVLIIKKTKFRYK